MKFSVKVTPILTNSKTAKKTHTRIGEAPINLTVGFVERAEQNSSAWECQVDEISTMIYVPKWPTFNNVSRKVTQPESRNFWLLRMVDGMANSGLKVQSTGDQLIRQCQRANFRTLWPTCVNISSNILVFYSLFRTWNRSPTFFGRWILHMHLSVSLKLSSPHGQRNNLYACNPNWIQCANNFTAPMVYYLLSQIIMDTIKSEF